MPRVDDFHEKLKEDRRQKWLARINIDSFVDSLSVSAGKQLPKPLAIAMLRHITPNVFADSYDLILLQEFFLVAALNDIDLGVAFFKMHHTPIKEWWDKILTESEIKSDTQTEKLAKIIAIPEFVAGDIAAVVLNKDFNHASFDLTAHTMTQFIAGSLAQAFKDHLINTEVRKNHHSI